MQHSSSRLYSGPLSEAAQKVLVALRAQNLPAVQHSHSYSYNHSQMEECCGSQRVPWTQSRSTSQDRRDAEPPLVSSFSTCHHGSSNQTQNSQTLVYYQYSQTQDCSLSSSSSSCWDSSLQRQRSERTEGYYQHSQMYSHRKYSEPHAYQSSQALFPQREVCETTVSSTDRRTLSLQISERLPDQAPTPTPTEEIRQSFILSLSPQVKSPNEVLLPTMEDSNAHKEECALGHHPFSPCVNASVKTNNGSSGSQTESTECWNIPVKVVEASNSQLKWTQPLSDHTDEASNGGGSQSKQPKSRTFTTGRINLCPSGFLSRQDTYCDAKSTQNPVGQEEVDLMVNSGNMIEAGAGQMSDSEHEMEVEINGAGREGKEAVLPTEKNSTSEMEGVFYSDLQSCFYLVTASKSSDLNHGGAKLWETDVNEVNFSACEVDKAEHLSHSENKAVSAGNTFGSPPKVSPSLLRVVPGQTENPQVLGQTVIETAEEDQTGGTLVQYDPTTFVTFVSPDNLEKTTEERVDMTATEMEENIERPAKADIGTATEKENVFSDLPEEDTGQGRSGKDKDKSVMVAADSENASTENSGRESCLTLKLSKECRARGSEFREVPCLSDNVRTAYEYIRGSSSSTSVSTRISSLVEKLTPAALKRKDTLENRSLPTFQTHSHHPPLVSSFPLKRKREVLQDQNVNNPHKTRLIRRPPKWEPPRSSHEKAAEGEVAGWKGARSKISVPEHTAVPPRPQTKASNSYETEIVVDMQTEPCVPKQTQQRKSETTHRGRESTRRTAKQTPFSVTCKSSKHKPAICGPDQTQTSHEGANTGEPQPKSTAVSLTATLISDPKIKDSGKLDPDEKIRVFEDAGNAKALVLTMVYQDGTTQLDPEQKLTPPVCGLVVLMKNDLDSSTPEDFLGPNDSLVYLKLEQTLRSQQHTYESQTLFTRDLLLQVLSRSQLVVCYKAKDLLRTALQFYEQDLSWKQVAGSHIQDPQVSGWLLDPADPSSCYQDLFNKHCKKTLKTPNLGTLKASRVISGLSSLYWLNKELCSKLQTQGLWELYSGMEMNMIPVLAAMESHCIHVDKEALKRTSDLLGTKMKRLEHDAHQAAGQIFLVTSNSQLRTVLFEKLRLHECCENKRLPKTINKQQQSTSEATLLQLQHLHPLPRVILEYRQVHKIKSTFVDGILSCMMSKNCISSTWYQTSTVTGRITAKHPNFQALPRQSLQISKKQYIQGKEQEVVTVHPRAMFIPQEGWTFLAADFCQVELRLLAHLSSDPELLRIFTNPQADVFTMLASQWKGVSEGEVTSQDREHAKRIVYSIVYGAGCKRLSGILGVSPEQASQFQDSFLQTYRDVKAFIQRTILQCHKQGYVLSIMGRRRTLPNIHSPDWVIRMQAERQAVNFVVQGSAADLCKMAMIRIFKLVSSSTSLSARLIAQLHDELLYEVEDSQVEHFAALVKSTMESLQHIHHFGVHLKVPLKVAVSSGKSWGSMSELNIPSTSPTPCL